MPTPAEYKLMKPDLRISVNLPKSCRGIRLLEMTYCDITLPSPQENLACDEALLEACEDGHGDEALRFWEPAQNFVVVGYANEVAKEVNLRFCEQNNIPVLRRFTGGGT